MLRRGGANELIVRDPEPPPGVGEPLGHLVGERLRREAPVGSGLRHLLAMLVHPDEEPDVVPAEPTPPGNDIGPHLLVCMPEVGVAVRVIDRRRDVEARHLVAGRRG